MNNRILMAMSGGIDSSVAAMLLLEQGYELVGVTFRTFDSIKESCLRKEKGCCSVESIMEAKHLAQKLGFEHHILDYRQIFRESVIQNFIDEYMCGRTPNPCVLCNSHIKWGEMLRAADDFGCDMIATGHYAQIQEYNNHLYLKNAVDERKDQTYFLWMLTEDNLRRTRFPLGALTKQQVREIAAQHGFKQLSQKTESQEICFIPDNDYRHFLENEGCEVETGDFIDENGKILGQHQGYPFYTIGQRKGLGIALGQPKFVTKINADTNQVTLGSREDLFATIVNIRDVRVRDDELLEQDPIVQVRIRYRSPAVNARIVSYDSVSKNLTLQTITPVWGLTPGQSAIIYFNNLLIGGGIIK